MTRNEMMNAIDRMIIYEKDYITLKKMIDVLEDKLFVKILEEILEGRIFLSDFERIFLDESYISTLSRNLETQDKLRKELDRMLAFKREVDADPAYAIDPTTTKIGITIPSEGTDIRAFYDEVALEVRKDQLYSLFETVSSDSLLIREAKLRVANLIQDGEIDEEDILLFSRDYILPIDIEHQVLDKNDMQFMTQNNLSEQQVKKLKALSYFLRREKVVGGE